jgi:Na+/melibiose symporter-like transporter
MLTWLGAPRVAGRGRVVAAIAVDSLGEGLFIPFFVVFLIHVAQVPVSQIGIACPIAAVLALPAGPVLGRLVDTVGPVPVIVVSNAVRAASYVALLAVGDAVGLVVVLAVSLAAGEAFWTANSVFISQIAQPAEHRRWFAFQRSLRNVGVGAGALATAFILLVAERTGAYVAFLLANSVSYLLAALLVWSWSRSRRPEPAAGRREEKERAKGWLREALADRTFRSLSLTNVIYVVGGLAPGLLWTYYAVDILHAPLWLPGVLFGVNTAIAAGLQLPVNRLAERASAVASLYGALAGWVVSFVLLAVLASDTSINVIAGFLVVVLVYSLGEILFGATLGALTVRAAPAHVRGRYLGLYQLSWTLSSIIAPAALLPLSGIGPAIPWIVLAAVAALTVIPLRNLRRLDLGTPA